jgi:curved DNA-binding protein CbpA
MRPHEVLGVEPDADREAVEAAYKRRVKEAHPDHGGSVAEFRRVREAYERLQDASRPGDSPVAADDGDESAGPNGRTPPRYRRADAEAPAESDAPERPEVEYVNYEVFEDFGWSLDDENLFENAAAADLDDRDYGRFEVDDDETLLEAAEDAGFAWPFACRGGACANCAVAVTEGSLSMPANHVLPDDMLDRDVRLSCVGEPTSERLRVVYNLKHLPDLEDLRLPPRPFKAAYPEE